MVPIPVPAPLAGARPSAEPSTKGAEAVHVRTRFKHKRLWSAAAAVLAGVLAVGPQALADDIPPDVPELPAVPPDTVKVDEFTVHAASETGTNSTVPLLEQRTYILEAQGVVNFGNGNADAECANFGDLQPQYKREWFTAAPNTVDLLVDNAGIEWTPVTPDAENCDTADHVYRAFLTPATTTTHNFLFNDLAWRGDNSGALTVRIYQMEDPPDEGVLIDQFGVSAANPQGGFSGATLLSSRSYRIQVTGKFNFTATNEHDAECANMAGQWVSQEPLDGATSAPDLWVDGAAVTWTPSRGRHCDADHTYNLIRNGKNSPVNLKVNDSWHGDNFGALAVKIFEVGDPVPDDSAGVGSLPVPSLVDPAAVASEIGTGDAFIEQLAVDSTDPTPKSTTAFLPAGHIYLIEATGRVRFGPGLADAECANFDTQPLFKREWFTTAPDTADLLVDGKGTEWTASVPDAQGCNTVDHKYSTYFVPSTTQRLSFLFNDGGWRGDNSGTIAVRIFQTDKVPSRGTQIDHFGFDTRNPNGASSTVSLSPTTSYRIKVQGLYTYTGSSKADPECVYLTDPNNNALPKTPGDRQDRPEVPPGASGGFDAAGSTPDVILNLGEVRWIPMQGRTGCDERTYSYIYDTAGLSGPVNLRVRDTWHGDNSGLVEVRVYELGPAGDTPASPLDAGGESPAVPNPEASPNAIPVDVLSVDSRSAEPVSTHTGLLQGEKYFVRVTGVVQFGAGNADAECVNFAPLQPLYKREWFTAQPHTADLLVDGHGVEWTAAIPDAEGCDSQKHAYTYAITPPTTKTYSFLFNDGGWRGDNSGSFKVEVFLTDRVADTGTQIDAYGLQAADADGENSQVALLADHTYRVKVAGSFTFAADRRSSHDAECVRVAGSPGDRQDRPGAPAPNPDAVAGTPDVLVNSQQVSWIASQGRTGCDDATNTYLYDISGFAGNFNLRVRDGWHGDNVGLLSVKVYDLGVT